MPLNSDYSTWNAYEYRRKYLMTLNACCNFVKRYVTKIHSTKTLKKYWFGVNDPLSDKFCHLFVIGLMITPVLCLDFTTVSHWVGLGLPLSLTHCFAGEESRTLFCHNVPSASDVARERPTQ